VAATDPSPSVELTPPLDVSVSGPPVAIRGLSAKDFVVTLNSKVTSVASVESLCQPLGSEHPRISTRFFLYFDQTELNDRSRTRAIQTAKILVPKLVATGGEVAIVANGTRPRMLAPPSSDGPALLRALEKLEQDENRVEFRGAKSDYYVKYSEFEIDRTVDPDHTGRLAAMMGTFSALGPPNVVLYFADRGRPWMYGSSTKRAAAFGGFRVHTVEKVTTDDMFDKALEYMAEENGGIFFRAYDNASRIAEQILRKESCLYRLRFERSQVPADAELVTRLTIAKRNVKVSARAAWYAPTPDMTAAERFAATLAAPLEHLENPGLIVQVIPAGSNGSRQTGLVQVRLDAATAGAARAPSRPASRCSPLPMRGSGT
jgi:hypothetical protein